MDVPTCTVRIELERIGSLLKRFFIVGLHARFVVAEHVDDVKSSNGFSLGFTFEEAVLLEERSRFRNVVFWSDGDGNDLASFVFDHGAEASALVEQSSEAVPVPFLTRGAGDYGIKSFDDGVFGLDIIWICCRNLDGGSKEDEWKNHVSGYPTQRSLATKSGIRFL